METQRNFNDEFYKENLPNSNGSFVLGILALVSSVVLCCCYGYILGIILSIIGLILGINAKNNFQLNPDKYTEKSYRKAKMGITLNIIGLITSIIVTIILFTLIYMGFTGQLPAEFQEAFDEAMEKYK